MKHAAVVGITIVALATLTTALWLVATERPGIAAAPLAEDSPEPPAPDQTREPPVIASADLPGQTPSPVVETPQAELARLRGLLAQIHREPDPRTVDQHYPIRVRIARAHGNIAVRTRFLELAPRDPAAMRQLQCLVVDHRVTGQPRAGLATLERLGPELGAKTWELDGLRAMLHFDAEQWEDLASVGERLLHSHAPDGVRAHGLMWIVQAKEALHEDAEARRRLEDLVERFAKSRDPEARTQVRLARTSLGEPR